MVFVISGLMSCCIGKYMSGLLRCLSPSLVYLSSVSTTMVSPLSAFFIIISFLFFSLLRVVLSAMVRLSFGLLLASNDVFG